MNELYITALVIGLTGSLHCVGMCGPIVIALGRGGSSTLNLLSYNIGRVITYSMMGMLFGAVGGFLNLSAFQQYSSIIIGAAMLVYLVLRYSRINRRFQFNDTLISRVARKLIGKAMKSKSGLLVVGMANGILPCGLVYLAATGSAASGSWYNGALVMAIFGAATIPVMLLLPILTNLVPAFKSLRTGNWVPYILTVFAILFILRGMDLGIPFISPEISNAASGEVSCH